MQMIHLKPYQEKVVQSLVESAGELLQESNDSFPNRIRTRLGDRVRSIMLFGSQARGDARSDSDTDYLVVVSEVSSDVNDILDDEAGTILATEGRVISAFAVSEADFERYVFSPVFINIRREGIAV